jgi:hypothetical protein
VTCTYNRLQRRALSRRILPRTAGSLKPSLRNLRIWLPLRRSAQPCCGLDLLERRLMESHTTVIVPFDDRVIFVSLLNCAEFSSRLSEVAQTLDAISGIQFLVGGTRLGEWWSLCTV